ncbi:hypothetical protein [Ramlibacter albus]|uniref:DUF2147 domain-containing protein n=1 Tax=Ramlibacter albus TaxID=2079448 RepID=A0A923M8Z9_9BURK|nr:hypothetical protein [Ramlibacter albus]MBC5765103.1 hypothetical protein [Ramlibacter albus]
MKKVACLLLLLSPLFAAAQECPRPVDVKVPHLLGMWHAVIEGVPQGATLLFEKHPLYTASVSGAINRNGDKGVVSGELEDGEFSMEESADGRRIFATWVGAVVEGSCGREIRGTWQRDGAALAHPFVLRKLPS